ncbi:MAG: hypothetical protein FJ135_00285 [Deltaproteobacteria bacterium]|nr:hypothetical protein [Deltaproteobacteria bacterium]
MNNATDNVIDRVDGTTWRRTQLDLAYSGAAGLRLRTSPGDAQDSVRLRADYTTGGGAIQFGKSDTAPDCHIYRTGASLLKSNAKMGFTGGIGVGNSTDGDVTATAKTKKVQIFDADGNSLGYLQVYAGP